MWDLNATKRHLHDLRVNDDDENDHHHYHDELTAKLVLPPPIKIPIDDGRSLWKKLLRNEVDASHFSCELLEALSSIIVLDDEQRERDWLNRFGGQLHTISSALLEGLR